MVNDLNDRPDSDPLFADPPRAWHYDLAHRFLRDPVFAHPDLLAEAIDDLERLTELVAIAVECCALEHEGLPMAEVGAIADAITIHVEGARTASIAAFEMPPPVFPTECYFVAIDFSDEGVGHYFTLERKDKHTTQTMFCAWDGHGRHLNYGDGPAPAIDDFV